MVKERLEAIVNWMYERGISSEEAQSAVATAYVERALRDARGNKSRAAKLLGCHRNTMNNRVAVLGVDLRGIKKQVRSAAASGCSAGVHAGCGGDVHVATGELA